jgi:hypothetical protein
MSRRYFVGITLNMFAIDTSFQNTYVSLVSFILIAIYYLILSNIFGLGLLK